MYKMYHHTYLLVSLLFLISGVESTFSEPCETPIGPMGVCYWLAPVTVSSQAAAIEQCATEGGILGSVQTSAIRDYIRTYIDFSHLSTYMWFGLNDQTVDLDYRWIDQSLVTWTDWSPGNPHERSGEDCGVLDSSWKFVDSQCSGNYRDPALCQGLPFDAQIETTQGIHETNEIHETTEIQETTETTTLHTTAEYTTTQANEQPTTSAIAPSTAFINTVPQQTSIGDEPSTPEVQPSTKRLSTEHEQTSLKAITTSIDDITNAMQYLITTEDVYVYTSSAVSSTASVSFGTEYELINSTEQPSAISTELVSTPQTNCFFPTWSPGIQYEIINQSLVSYLIYTCTETDTDSNKWRMAHIYMTTCLHNERWWPPIQECSALPIIFSYTAVEAQHAEYIGGFAFILVSSAIGMILVIDLATLQVSSAVLAIYTGFRRGLKNCCGRGTYDGYDI